MMQSMYYYDNLKNIGMGIVNTNIKKKFKAKRLFLISNFYYLNPDFETATHRILYAKPERVSLAALPRRRQISRRSTPHYVHQAEVASYFIVPPSTSVFFPSFIQFLHIPSSYLQTLLQHHKSSNLFNPTNYPAPPALKSKWHQPPHPSNSSPSAQ
jgi:hypothetical protein